MFVQRTTLANYVLAITIAVLILIGRWTLQRLSVDPDAVNWELVGQRDITSLAIEPRFWLLIICLPLVEIGRLSGQDTNSFRNEAGVSLRLFLVLILYLFATIWWSPNENPYPKAADLLLTAMTVIVVERASRNMEFVKAFWLCLEFVLLAIGGFALYAQLFLVADLTSAAMLDQGRLSILGGGPNILGRFLGMLCLLMVARSLNQRGGLSWSIALRILVAGVAVVLLLQTGSRGAMVALLLGLFALLVVRRVDWRLIAVGFLVVLSLVYLFGAILDIEAIQGISDRWVESTLQEGYLSNRDVLYDVAYELWLEAPTFGGGLDSFPVNSFGLDNYPHNMVLELAVDGGIVAVLLLFAWGGHLIAKTWNGRNYYSEIGLSMSALIFGAGMFSGDFYDCRLVYIFGVVAIAAATQDVRASDALPDEAEHGDEPTAAPPGLPQGVTAE